MNILVLSRIPLLFRGTLTFEVEMDSRVDVYEALQAFDALKPKLGAEESVSTRKYLLSSQRFVFKNLQHFKRKGVHLDEQTRAKITELNKRIKEIEIKCVLLRHYPTALSVF